MKSYDDAIDPISEPVVSEPVPAAEKPVCRHCGNTRAGENATICADCQRCTEPHGCGHSPTCPSKA